ncbi:hypothetical protein CEE44_04975 [Candidatus Woesearchaeota archaeon B3_Woes]|nr:MAG: hypothetical protein CEE44_04975 [Candidatus Woesearchaeota archaeon B3_Woes]
MKTNQTQEEQTLTLKEIVAQLDNETRGFQAPLKTLRSHYQTVEDLTEKESFLINLHDKRGRLSEDEKSSLINFILHEKGISRHHLEVAHVEAYESEKHNPERVSEMYKFMLDKISESTGEELNYLDNVILSTKSERILEQALSIARDKEQMLGEEQFTKILRSAASKYNKLGNPRKAVELYEETDDLLRIVKLNANGTSTKKANEKLKILAIAKANEHFENKEYLQAFNAAKGYDQQLARTMAKEGIRNSNNYSEKHTLYKILDMEPDEQTKNHVEKQRLDDYRTTVKEDVSFAFLDEEYAAGGDASKELSFWYAIEKLVEKGFAEEAENAITEAITYKEEMKQSEISEQEGERFLQVHRLLGGENYLDKAISAFKRHGQYDELTILATEAGNKKQKQIFRSIDAYLKLE